MNEQENEAIEQPNDDLLTRSAGHLLAMTGEQVLEGGALMLGGLVVKDVHDKITGKFQPPEKSPPADDE